MSDVIRKSLVSVVIIWLSNYCIEVGRGYDGCL